MSHRSIIHPYPDTKLKNEGQKCRDSRIKSNNCHHNVYGCMTCFINIIIRVSSLVSGLKRNYRTPSRKIKCFVNKLWPYHLQGRLYLRDQGWLLFRYRYLPLSSYYLLVEMFLSFLVILQRTPDNGNVLNGETKPTHVRMCLHCNFKI